MFGNMVRTFIITLTLKTEWARRLTERAIFTEVGITGHLASHDGVIVKEKGLKKLNRFEKWLLEPSIEYEKTRRRKAFTEALTAVTGEEL